MTDRKSTRLNSSHMSISYAVFCLNVPATTGFSPLSLHDALPILSAALAMCTALCLPAAGALAANILFENVTLIDGTGTAPLAGASVLVKDDRIDLVSPVPLKHDRSEEHTSELQSHVNLVCRLLLECSGDYRVLSSFPTRRSSDLERGPGDVHGALPAGRRRAGGEHPVRERHADRRHRHRAARRRLGAREGRPHRPRLARAAQA